VRKPAVFFPIVLAFGARLGLAPRLVPMKHRALFPFSLAIVTNRRAAKRICKGTTAVLALALWLSGTAHSAFGQSTCQQPNPVPTDPMHTIIPVHFNASTGDITVGSKTYCGANPGFHLLALLRQPDNSHLDAPDTVLDQNYTDAASVASALQTILQTPGNPIVMVNAVGDYKFYISDVAQALTSFGAYQDLAQIPVTGSFIFVGIGGGNPNTALQRGFSTRDIDGYLAPDSNTNYAFIQTDYVRYDITTDGTIKIGSKSYPVAAAHYNPLCDAAASDSFHLVIVDRESPDRVFNDGAYCTRQNPLRLLDMATDLRGVTGVNELVFIATNGHPIPADWNFGTDGDVRVYSLAHEIARLGGYWETMVYLTPNDTYSLVGAPVDLGEGARESSTVYPASKGGKTPTGELHGVLSRGRGNLYSPLNADKSGLVNLGLYEILAPAPTSFPQFTGDQLTAFQNISQRLAQTLNQTLPESDTLREAENSNIRNAYGNLNATLQSAYSTLESMTPPDCTDPNNAGLPFCIVREQLLTELNDAIAIQKFYGNVKDFLSTSGTVNILTSLSAYDDVKATIPAPPTAESPNLVRPLVSFFLDLATEVPVVGKVFGIANVAFNFGMDLATDQQGNKTIDLTSTIGQLHQQAADQFTAEYLTNGTLFQIVLQDYGKFSTLASKLVSGSEDPASPWYWDTTATGQMLSQMQTAVKQAAYQNVMAAAYAIGKYLPRWTYQTCNGEGPWPAWGQTPIYVQPWSYNVEDWSYKRCLNAGLEPTVAPFNSTAAGYIPYTYPNDPTNPYATDSSTGTILADLGWLGISLQTSDSQGGEEGVYNPPDRSLLSNLFTPASQGGLGVYRPAFFEGWPFPHVTCLPAASGSGSIGGCPWSAGMPPQARPSPANLSVRATQISRNQTVTDVLLTVFNGTGQERPITISSVSLQTLAGSGQATVKSPAMPILIKGLAPGDSANVILNLNIPRGITKLKITAQGSAATQPIRFSNEQVLYPNK
jgi:hypothetical protein